MLLVSDMEPGVVSWLFLGEGPEAGRDNEWLTLLIGEETRCGEGLRLLVGGVIG